MSENPILLASSPLSNYVKKQTFILVTPIYRCLGTFHFDLLFGEALHFSFVTSKNVLSYQDFPNSPILFSLKKNVLDCLDYIPAAIIFHLQLELDSECKPSLKVFSIDLHH